MNAILCDVTRCTACEECVKGCVSENGLGETLPAERASRDGLSGRRVMSVIEVAPNAHARKACFHCVEPACADACLVGALHKTEDGPVTYDADKCIGCRYCMLSCPFSIPRYEWDKKLPFVSKCTMCAERQKEGKQPVCVESCPNGALTFGDRDELLAEAHKRIKGDPNTYMDHVFGEEEVGGTCVLYLSHVALDALGWPERVGEKPLAAYTWPVMSKTPGMAVSVFGGLTALAWIINRRNQMASERAVEATAPQEPQHEVEE